MFPERQRPTDGHNGESTRRDAAKELVAALFTHWYGPMVRYAYRTTGLFEAAEDVVQGSFTELYRTLLQGKTVTNPKGWILCVVRREIVDRIREERRHGGALLDLAEVDRRPQVHAEPDIHIWAEADLSRLLAGLSAREEEVLLLRAQSLKYRQIALELKIGINSVKTLLARAVRKMQAATGAENCAGKGLKKDGKPISASLQ